MLRLIFQSIVGFGHQLWLLPGAVVIALKQRRQQIALAEIEAERLDRIRNPSNYRGK